jgi:hypothetical protein
MRRPCNRGDNTNDSSRELAFTHEAAEIRNPQSHPVGLLKIAVVETIQGDYNERLPRQ